MVSEDGDAVRVGEVDGGDAHAREEPRVGVSGSVRLPYVVRMPRQRLTVSVDSRFTEMIKDVGAHTPGGVSGYVERLIRQDWLRRELARLQHWGLAHPGYIADSIEESEAAAEVDAA